jgi:hypothetical protein
LVDCDEVCGGGTGEGWEGGCGQVEVLEGVGGGDGEDGYAGASGGFDADVGVFDDEAIGWGEVEFFGGEEKDVGGGFSVGDIISTDDGGEVLVEACCGEDGVEVFAWGGGSDGCGDILVAEGGEEFAGAGEDVDTGFADEGAVEGFLAVGESFDFLRECGPVKDLGNDEFVLLPEAEFEMAGGKGFGNLGGEKFP